MTARDKHGNDVDEVEVFKKYYPQIKQKIYEIAERKHVNFAFSGAMSGDDGSGMKNKFEMIEQIIIHRQIPTEYFNIIEEIKKEQDPEWKEYQRLKEKFNESK